MIPSILAVKGLLACCGVALSAIFSGAETAFTSLSPKNLQEMESGGSPGLAKAASFWRQYPNPVLACLLLGTNFTHVLISVMASSAALDIASALNIPVRWPSLVLCSLAILIVLLLGEILPKVYGRLHARGLSRLALPFIIHLVGWLDPMLRHIVRIAEKISGHASRQTAAASVPLFTSQDLEWLLARLSSSEVSAVSSRMLKNLVSFGRSRVSEVMVPRERMFCLDVNDPLEKIVDAVVRCRLSRVPVYRGNLDNIVGFVYAKDLLYTWLNRELILLEDLLRPPVFISETASVAHLLRLFQSGEQHLALIQDSEMRIRGLVTIEDLMELIIGEIKDEFDA